MCIDKIYNYIFQCLSGGIACRERTNPNVYNCVCNYVSNSFQLLSLICMPIILNKMFSLMASIQEKIKLLLFYYYCLLLTYCSKLFYQVSYRYRNLAKRLTKLLMGRRYSQGIMLETFISLIKASHLAEKFVLTYSLIRYMTSLENRPLKYVGAMKIVIYR